MLNTMLPPLLPTMGLRIMGPYEILQRNIPYWVELQYTQPASNIPVYIIFWPIDPTWIVLLFSMYFAMQHNVMHLLVRYIMSRAMWLLSKAEQRGMVSIYEKKNYVVISQL